MKQYVTKNKSTYDRLADEFKSKIALRLPNDQKIIDKFLRYVPKGEPNRRKILDLGTGNGNMCLLLTKAGFDVSAIEISTEMAKIAQENAKDAKIIVSDFLTYDFQEKFDGILAVAFIHLFNKEDVYNVLQKIRKLLNDDGVVFISTTKHDISEEGLFTKENFKEKAKRFRHRYTRKELKDLLTTNGFQIKHYSENTGTEVRDKIWMNFVVTIKE